MKPAALARAMTIVAAATLLSGCVTVWKDKSTPNIATAAEPAGPSYQPVPFTEEEFARLEADEAEIREQLADRTTLVDASKIGRMVEYTLADGRAYLWTPGAREVVAGQWKVEPAARPAKVHVRTDKGIEVREMTISNLCFRYQPTSTVPAGALVSGNWSCRLYTEAAKARLESRAGDIFRLAERAAVPYPLAPEKATLGALLSRCGDC
ncbi:MAG: hypothetical protein R3D02_03660 [Hyphomicrobiales bacterium]